MKRFHKYIMGAGLLALTLATTSCEDETFPTDRASQEQAAASASATRALVFAMPAYFNQVDENLLDNNNWHAVFGYGAMMIARDLQTGDRSIGQNYNGHFRSYMIDQYLGKRYTYSSYPWSYYYGFVLTANKAIGGINISTADDKQKGYYGIAHAFRALLYLDLARTYEFLDNDAVKGVSEYGKTVTGLTVPIVTDSIDETGARSNPRATREQMKTFILSDLDKAEANISYSTETGGGTLPTLACVYGLKARLYMWVEDYAKAAEYAKKAIDQAAKEGIDPMTEDECLDATTGFNDISKWMWGAQQTSENYSVQTGIVNWTSWASNETDFGYAGAGAYNLIDASLYAKISDTDFRKLEFMGPNGPVAGQEFNYSDYYETTFDNILSSYQSLKFRPAQGNAGDYQTGSASAYPVMRVEEMYFIHAEATAHQDFAAGKALIEQYMTSDLARDPQYTCSATSTDELVQEIVLQKRIELWGEGQTFFDVKRLNMSVDRTYDGNNWVALARLKTTGRPAWMNWMMPQSEEKNNAAVLEYNNPDPSDAYTKQ